MANHRSSTKRAQQDIKRSARNKSIKGKVKSAIKGFRESLTEGDVSKAQELLSTAATELRRAGSKGVFHKNTVSRQISRLAASFNALRSA